MRPSKLSRRAARGLAFAAVLLTSAAIAHEGVDCDAIFSKLDTLAVLDESLRDANIIAVVSSKKDTSELHVQHYIESGPSVDEDTVLRLASFIRQYPNLENVLIDGSIQGLLNLAQFIRCARPDVDISAVILSGKMGRIEASQLEALVAAAIPTSMHLLRGSQSAEPLLSRIIVFNEELAAYLTGHHARVSLVAIRRLGETDENEDTLDGDEHRRLISFSDKHNPQRQEQGSSSLMSLMPPTFAARLQCMMSTARRLASIVVGRAGLALGQ